MMDDILSAAELSVGKFVQNDLWQCRIDVQSGCCPGSQAVQLVHIPTPVATMEILVYISGVLLVDSLTASPKRPLGDVVRGRSL
jgi:hypothetical protein